MSQIVEIDDKIEVDKISVEEVNTDNNIEIDKLIDNDKSPHNGEPITLFKGISIYDTHSKLEITQNSTKWEIISLSDNNKIKLQVIKKIKVGNSWDIRYTRAQNFKLLHNNLRLYKMKLFNDSDIIILTTMGLLIYHFNDDDKSISLNYFYYMDLFFNKKGVKYYKKVFSKDTLPLPNYDSFKYNDEWISHIKNNKECLLKYGVGLLKFAIKEHNLDLIEEIYEKCIIHFKEDLKNNVKFLSIITSTIPLLNKHYPEYIAKYLLDTAMIIDSSVYNIERLNALLGCFTTAATIPQQYINDNIQKQLLITSIILGFIHLSFEVRQFIYNPNKWFRNFWNIFVPTYIQVFENGTNNSNPILIQQPDGNTNMFVNFKTALFAMYLFLTGDSSALSNWSYIDNSALTIMIVLFSLLIVIYLMNLFIGLLNIAIEKDNNRVSYLIQKAEILAEIELFYLLPYQRRWNTWFPEIIYYYASVDKSREKVKDMINKGEWNTNKFPELKEDLLSKLNIQSVNKTNLQ
ncbi:hypothetical protein RhiirA1_438512 [Rhizophagus irregularis]|uniref:Ion transport domain-containing protein n=1 Tax=Rhizophagus irregularis TaxID=588596 RepID=A0A2N0S8X1_9GLOM|nr:hypothetical protein RhiirA1_438512 [Rhizophagus irregularis]